MKKTETWAGLREYRRRGRYFELLSSAFPVDITAYDADDRVIASEPAVTSGYFIDRTKLEQGPDGQLRLVSAFDRIELNANGGGDTITFLITDGQAGSNVFSTDISDRAGRLLGVIYGSLGQVAQVSIGGVNHLVCAARQYPTVYGAQFSSIASLASATNEQALAPGSNVNGLWYWDSILNAGTATTGSLISLLAKSSAPASAVDGVVLSTLVNNLISTAAQVMLTMQNNYAKVLAAALGLFFRNAGGGTEANPRVVTYTIL